MGRKLTRRTAGTGFQRKANHRSVIQTVVEKVSTVVEGLGHALGCPPSMSGPAKALCGRQQMMVRELSSELQGHSTRSGNHARAAFR